jgi:uncharacterized protein YdiU (UPF0061 family)
MLLRHDVDFCANSAYRIYQIEKGLNVTSSFYFRWKTTNEKVMKQMHENFFETSLHFETLATYCIRHGIYKSQHVTHKILNDCLEILKNEIKMFKDCFWQIKTISSHGAKRNQVLGIPNHRLIDNIDRKELGIYFETYDSEIQKRFDRYISDDSVINRYRWKNSMTPIEAIDRNLNTICLLTHPNNWHFSASKNLRTFIRDVKNKFFAVD